MQHARYPFGTTLSGERVDIGLPPKAARTVGPPEGAAAPLPRGGHTFEGGSELAPTGTSERKPSGQGIATEQARPRRSTR
jgi:hypothetical protein